VTYEIFPEGVVVVLVTVLTTVQVVPMRCLLAVERCGVMIRAHRRRVIGRRN